MFEAIRRDRRDDPDVSIRELAVRHGVHRRTVRQALASAEPPPRKVPVRTAPVLDPVKPLIDAMLSRLEAMGKAVKVTEDADGCLSGSCKSCPEGKACLREWWSLR